MAGPDDRTQRKSAEDIRATQALGWFAGWFVAVAVGSMALAVAYPAAAWQAGVAATALCVPALAGAFLPRGRHETTRALLLVLWGMGGALACIMAGGVSGPLAVWCLAPVAAASALGGARRMAEGAALAFMAAAVAAMAQLSGAAPAILSGQAGFWMGLLALSTTGLGLGAGLVMLQRRTVLRDGRRLTELLRIEQLLTEQPHLIVVISPRGQVVSVDGRTPEGLDRRLLSESGLSGVAAPGYRSAISAALRRAFEDGEAQVGFAPAAALERWLGVTIAKLADGRLLAVLRDATADRDREAQLEQGKADAEALATGKSRFLANMSHELRTPLNAIMGFADIMRSKMFGPLPDKYAEYGALIHESGSHLLDLINDVLDMSKIEAERYQLSREIFDARESVSAALRLMRLQADGAGIQLRGVLPPVILEVDADRRAIKQIVLNLVSNALKFTPKGGSVTVSAHGYDGVFELTVSDTGVGISREDLEKLGRPYEQGEAGRRVQGTGLGLSLVRSFAELHGGEMGIESTLGEGTSISVRLPVLISPEEQPDTRAIGDNVVAFNPQR